MSLDPLEERARGRVGTVLHGKYRIDRVLGVGGMAVVYKATHRNQAEFAVKMLHPELSLNAEMRERFLREGYAANSVRHPGVVRVVDDDVAEDGSAFLVMELLDGISCESLRSPDGSPLFLDGACAMALELLDVLAAAHAQGIVHRDIKPANCFLLRDGSLKVLDFGIARVKLAMGGSAHATGTGMVLGTPAFMAPEQAVGKPSEVDARADLWAVGVSIFSLATGKMVHDAETASHLLVKLATEQARSLATVLPSAPAPIVQVVDRALALDRAQRWPSAIAMRDALTQARLEVLGPYAPAPRAVLAPLVASLAPPSIRPPGVGDAKTESSPAFPPPRPTPAAGGSPHASLQAADTGQPVSREGGGSRGRATRRAVASILALAACATIAGALSFLRARRSPGAAAAPPSSSAVAATVRSAPEPSPPPVAVAPTPPILESPDAAAPLAATTPAPAKVESPAHREAAPRPAGKSHGEARPTGSPHAESPQAPPAAAQTVPPAAATAVDPLDGRR
ncbi:MAG TPA: serine/threonine-protein kinase [Polyangiaceae bacterium]|nr:serine/threonine-protein kinase [Polyangiaceae bacterium]